MEPSPTLTGHTSAHSAAPPSDPLDRFVERHQKAIWRYLRLLGATTADADDLTQEAFLIALRKQVEARPTGEAAAFLHRTARNLWRNRTRDDKRRAAKLIEVADRIFVAELADDGGDRWVDALRACLSTLSERARSAIHLFYIDRLSRLDIGAKLGIRENGVKTLLQRTRAHLGRCIERTIRP